MGIARCETAVGAGPELPAPAAARADLLLCADGDNTIRWAAGERLHNLFEQLCDRLSEHPAVESAEGVVSFSDLDRRANRLASYLRKVGAGAGDMIGLLFERSADSYVAMLAVMKIGASYVPLDPGFPQDRIAFIAQDASLHAILTVAEYTRLVARTPVVCLDTLAKQIEAEPPARPREMRVEPPADELCYVIYTSGTTGRPKGVPITHASICNFVRVAAELYGYRPGDRVYQGLTIAFDFSVEEIWVPLIAGATLVPNQTGGSLLGRELGDFLKSKRITALCCVPTLLATIEDELPNVRLLLVSGEVCPRDLIARWHRPDRTILNAYGPTEATVTTTLAVLEPDAPVTIGKPLPTYTVVILSPDRDEAFPRGETGEIGVAGICLSPGYLNRPELTREKFIADFLGLSDTPTARIYRTGDLGRVNSDGMLEYLGRIDTQVKIRGYRIELAEIESVIMKIRGVAQAVVNTHEAEPGATELVAYYTRSETANGLTTDDIARELRAILPTYMVPAFYECLPAMPLLPSDKVDRKALPAPAGRRMHRSDGAYVAPQGPLETGIGSILADLLKLEQISVHDHFFEDLGANSLLMARFSSRLRRELNVGDVSMRDIYLNPTIRRFGECLTARFQTQPKDARPQREVRPNHAAPSWQYVSCGVMQFLLMAAYLCVQVAILVAGYHYMLNAEGALAIFGRALVASVVSFLAACLVPVALKWLLIGRWRAAEFPVWSLRYLRFWAVKELVALNPMVAFVGSPLYVAYLKLLGAKVSWNAAVFSTGVPICSDLVTIGDGAVISRNVRFQSYRAEGGRIRTGSVTIGRNAFVGEASVLEIDTVIGDGAQLGHASALHAGQRLAPGRRYHGSPVEETDVVFDRLDRGTVRLTRRLIYSLLQLSLTVVGLTSALLLPVRYLHHDVADSLHRSTLAQALDLLLPTVVAYFATLLLGLTFTIALPRCLSFLLEPGRIYPLYGFHYFLFRFIHTTSNSALFNQIFGDSSFIVHYLRALGYRFKGGMYQTGSNFGVKQMHDIPALCEIGRGAMVSDGLAMIGFDASNASFQLSKVAIGANNFLGNNIFYPAAGKTGENCLLGTKVMVPIDGPLRENIGLLGSPCFAIPRSVRRDKQFGVAMIEEMRLGRLRKKNISNLITIALYLLSNLTYLCLMTFFAHVWFIDVELQNASIRVELHIALDIVLWLLMTVAGAFAWFALVERMSLRFGRLQPRSCSIYDDYFWSHERYWKLGVSDLLDLLNGTPFKPLVWRMLGVRVGAKLFDDGCSISEKTLATLGDYCTLNAGSALQSHSLEDGIFKSDHIAIGNRCTIGVNAFVHYGVMMEDAATLDADSFLMKGEAPAEASHWRGNPARTIAPS